MIDKLPIIWYHILKKKCEVRIMDYVSVAKMAEKWGISERSVRNYCAQGRIAGAKLIGKTWYIPEDAAKPERVNKKKADASLLGILREQKAAKLTGGIYHKVQIDLTYNSNHMEGSRLTHDQTRYIFETNTIGVTDAAVNVDDVIETANHFRCIDLVIDQAGAALTEKLIKELHFTLKTGTSDSRKDWFAVGEYKRLPNEVGGNDTTLPENVAGEMRTLLADYNARPAKTFEDKQSVWRLKGQNHCLMKRGEKAKQSRLKSRGFFVFYARNRRCGDRRSVPVFYLLLGYRFS